MYRVQGTLREWVTRDEVRRFIAKKFKEFLLTYVNPKNEHGEFEYVRLINEMVLGTMLLAMLITPFYSFHLHFLHFPISLLKWKSIFQLTNAAWRLITNSSFIFIQILLSGWRMHPNRFLRLWKRLQRMLYLISTKTTRIFTRRSMSG